MRACQADSLYEAVALAMADSSRETPVPNVAPRPNSEPALNRRVLSTGFDSLLTNGCKRPQRVGARLEPRNAGAYGRYWVTSQLDKAVYFRRTTANIAATYGPI